MKKILLAIFAGLLAAAGDMTAENGAAAESGGIFGGVITGGGLLSLFSSLREYPLASLPSSDLSSPPDGGDGGADIWEDAGGGEGAGGGGESGLEGALALKR